MKNFTDMAIRLSGVAAWALGWTPDVFWRATPDELGAIFGVAAGEVADGAPPDADTIRQLMERFPDG